MELDAAASGKSQSGKSGKRKWRADLQRTDFLDISTGQILSSDARIKVTNGEEQLKVCISTHITHIKF